MPIQAADVLKAEIEALLAQREEALAAIRRQRRQLHRIAIGLEILKRVQQQLATSELPPTPTATLPNGSFGLNSPPGEQQSSAPSPPPQNGTPRKLQKPSQAVLDYLRAHPGARAGAVVAILEDRIATTSGDKKKLLFNIIRQLEKRQAIRRGGDGGRDLFVIENASAEKVEEEDG